MGNEETTDGVGVEFENNAPENEEPLDAQPLVLDACEVSRPAAAPASAPDFYAVGVRLIKMSPVWLLTVTGGFAFLILLLSWVRPAGGEADAASIPNDAKAAVVQLQPAPVAAAKPSREAPVATPADEPKHAAEEHAQVAPETHPAEPVQAAKAEPAPAETKPAETKTEPAKEPAKASTPASDAGGKFTVQVGSFSVESQANERISSLRAAGFDARSTAVQIPGRGTWYRVHVGRFGGREEAAKAAAQLREKGAAAGSMVVALQ